MTRISKLEEDGHLEEAVALKDEGHGLQTIADKLNFKYFDGEKRYTHMAIKRPLEALEKRKLEKALAEGKGDELTEFNLMLRNEYNGFRKKLNKLVSIADKILKDALEDGSISDKTRALKEARENIKQAISIWESEANFAFRQIHNRDDYNKRNEQDIKILIINFINELTSTNLCPKCREEVTKKINNLVKP